MRVLYLQKRIKKNDSTNGSFRLLTGEIIIKIANKCDNEYFRLIFGIKLAPFFKKRKVKFHSEWPSQFNNSPDTDK